MLELASGVFSGQIGAPLTRSESWQNGDNSCQHKEMVFSTKDMTSSVRLTGSLQMGREDIKIWQ